MQTLVDGLAVDRQSQDLTDPPLEVYAYLPLREDLRSNILLAIDSWNPEFDAPPRDGLHAILDSFLTTRIVISHICPYERTNRTETTALISNGNAICRRFTLASSHMLDDFMANW